MQIGLQKSKVTATKLKVTLFIFVALLVSCTPVERREFDCEIDLRSGVWSQFYPDDATKGKYIAAIQPIDEWFDSEKTIFWYTNKKMHVVACVLHSSYVQHMRYAFRDCFTTKYLLDISDSEKTSAMVLGEIFCT